jgi:hypothetical protein
MGALWYIKKISPGFRPWFWYCDIQTPLAFSYFGNPGRLGSWGWRGFILWNNYPVIWILSENAAPVPMGEFGSPTLDLCARTTIIAGDKTIVSSDYQPVIPVPSGPLPMRARPDSSIPGIAVLDAASAGTIGLTGQANETTPFGPFGFLPMSFAPLGPPPDKAPYGLTAFGNKGSEIWSSRPNIWQLTGKDQPKLSKPDEPFNAYTNPYLPPNMKDAKDCAKKFEELWNKVANASNKFIRSWEGDGAPDGYPNPPPGWSWAVDYYWPGNGTQWWASFQNGIPPLLGDTPIEIQVPATVYTIKVDQLDPALWDTSHLEYYNNPDNYQYLAPYPPVLWKDDPHLPKFRGGD